MRALSSAALALTLTLTVAFTACDAAPGEVSTEGNAFTAASGQGPPTADDPSERVGTRAYSVTIDGLDRETLVYYPPSAVGKGLVPVVFMLHGTSGDGMRFHNISGWVEKADEVGFIAVFPSALTHCYHQDENGDGDFDDAGERKVLTKWASGKLGDPERMPLCTQTEIDALAPARRALADHPLADDIAFFDRMLDLLEDHYPVDAARIYVSGFSNGGSMSSRLALEMSDRFAAAAAAGGTLSLEATAASPPISMVFSLGAHDHHFTVPFGVDAFTVGEDFFTTPPGPAVAATILRAYLTLCDLSAEHTYRERVIGGEVVSDFHFATPLAPGADNELHFILIDGLGHKYPNGRNHPLRIADPLWSFFESKRRW